MTLKEIIAEHYPDVEFDILASPNLKLGDYSINLAFSIAKKEKKKPLEVARELAEIFSESPYFEKVQVAPPGFVNFFLKTGFLQEQLEDISRDKNYGSSNIGEGKKVIVEYSAPNIAKPMHVGHLRSTIIGDALANVYEILGYNVVRWNYLGDWGTQFGKLIAAYKLWGSKETMERNPIGAMLELYVQFHEELKEKPELEEKGQEEFKKLEEGDKENKKLWTWFREESLKDFRKTYNLLGVKFDITVGESAYESDLKPLIARLEKEKYIQESEGSLIFDLEKSGLPPALIRKSDGSSLYITRDIASLKHRVADFKPDKILYVVSNQQSLHFQQLFMINKLLRITEAELIHVKYGLVLNDEGKKFSTREGNAVPLQEVMDKVIKLALSIVKQKNPELSETEAEEVARAVGIGALKYNDFKQHPYSDIIFNWEAMLDFTGNSGPYLQYTHARLASILRKVGKSKAKPVLSFLKEPEERMVMKQLLDFPQAIKRSAELHTVNGLALYLYELANEINRFYEAHRIIEDEQEQRQAARLVLIAAAKKILERGMHIMGIESPDRI